MTAIDGMAGNRGGGASNARIGRKWPACASYWPCIAKREAGDSHPLLECRMYYCINELPHDFVTKPVPANVSVRAGVLIIGAA
jgi:hypothetical protein